MSKNGTILIIFAWAMEIVGVTGGAINSIYTTFGDNLPNTVWGYVPAVPMAALAMAEFGRVPLASTIFHKHKLMQGIAVLGMLALGYIAIENWTFGFERIVDLRLNSVKAASSELSRAEAELSALVEQQKRTANSYEQKREELRRGIEKRTASITELTAQRNNEDEVHRKNLQEIREACLRIRGECLRPRSLEEDARYKKALEQLSAELARQGKEREELQSQIDALVVTDNTKVAALDQKVSIAERTVIEARKSLRSPPMETRSIV